MINEECIKMVVVGRVQGVGFRYYTLEVAKKLNIKGSVRNAFNGTVEIIAQAPKKDLHTFIDYIKKGHALSNVNDITITAYPLMKTSGFKIRY
jgi:acylphosphatase